MKDQVDVQIDLLRKRSLPACPGNFEANVLRRIRRARGVQSEDTWMGWLNGLVSKTGFAVPVLALVITFSSLFSALSSTAVPVDRRGELNRAFGFDRITEAPVLALDPD